MQAKEEVCGGNQNSILNIKFGVIMVAHVDTYVD